MIIQRLATFLATFGYSGLIRPAPGTWGSLAALPVGWLIMWSGGQIALVAAILVTFGVGLWAARVHMRAHRTMHDPSEIVIDEAAGQWIPLLPFTTFDPVGYLLAFVGFRLFDIWKPGPVGWADRRLKGSLGVMADDIVAGIFAVICVLLLQYATGAFG
ncbi:MAG: phosphatidylglycerophosphatase A [Minwuia sp.]|nr:phosphatidylglycerophosphatase A [Minwuia sp.]